MKIHADLKPSRLRSGVEVGLYLIVAVLCALSGLPWWVSVFVVLALVIVFTIQNLKATLSARLVQLIQLDRRVWCWHEVTTSAQHGFQSVRVDAELRQVQRVGPVIVLRFDCATHDRAQSWVIWRDQVDGDNWRRLVVLARFWGDPLPQS